MKELNFLRKLKQEEKLKLVEPSDEIKNAYLKKSENCFRYSQILFENKLYENSISEAYYCMYNSLLALLFKVGIKSENHSASIILLKKLFSNNSLFESILFAKKERIDKQYYIESSDSDKLIFNSCEEMILKSEDFLIQIKVLCNELNNRDLILIKEKFMDMI